MALGCAVVAADAGGPAEIITDGVDGVLVEPSNVGALAEALTRLSGSPAERRALGEAARVRAGDFVGAKIAPQVQTVYTRVARRRTP
ncbi:MAG: glycosyltransferase [Actinobacteria bacterium]|nr:glycosyltransferase [Actinomycetota bacterium]